MQMRLTKGWAALLVVAAGCFVALYYLCDPSQYVWMPKCVFRLLTGYDCPSCGAQRALHALLHGDVVGAIRYNLFLLVAIPYLLAVAYTTFSHDRFAERMRPIVQHRYGMWAYIVLFFVWWVVRNTPMFRC